MVCNRSLEGQRFFDHNYRMIGSSKKLKQSTSETANPETSDATLTVICGCMFSGKTTELLRRISDEPSETVAVFKHEIDRRYALDAIVSHAGLAHPAVAVSSADELSSVCGTNIKLAVIDEAHFFGEDLAPTVKRLIERQINVIIAALDRDSWGRQFRVVENLVGLAGNPLVKVATCARCGGIADRTQRLTPIIDGDMVGGTESFEPRCRRCWRPPPEKPPD